MNGFLRYPIVCPFTKLVPTIYRVFLTRSVVFNFVCLLDSFLFSVLSTKCLVIAAVTRGVSTNFFHCMAYRVQLQALALRCWQWHRCATRHYDYCALQLGLLLLTLLFNVSISPFPSVVWSPEYTTGLRQFCCSIQNCQKWQTCRPPVKN